MPINSIHGSRTHVEASRHLQFFFPEERICVVLKPNLTEQQRGNEQQEIRMKESILFHSSGNRECIPKSWFLHYGTQDTQVNRRTSWSITTCSSWQRLLR